MTAQIIDPKADLLGVFDASTGKHAESLIGQVIRSGLAAGTGVSVSFDPATGKTTLATASGGGSAASVIPFAVAGGTASAITAAMNTPFTSLVSGDIALVRLTADIVGATTINVDALGASALVDPTGSVLVAGAGKAGDLFLILRDDTSKWRVMGGLREVPVSNVITATNGIIGPLTIDKTYRISVRSKKGAYSTLGTAYAGLWASVDNGATWTATSKTLSAVASGGPANPILFPLFYQPGASSSSAWHVMTLQQILAYTGKALNGDNENAGAINPFLGNVFSAGDWVSNVGLISGFSHIIIRPMVNYVPYGTLPTALPEWDEFRAVVEPVF